MDPIGLVLLVIATVIAVGVLAHASPVLFGRRGPRLPQWVPRRLREVHPIHPRLWATVFILMMVGVLVTGYSQFLGEGWWRFTGPGGMGLIVIGLGLQAFLQYRYPQPSRRLAPTEWPYPNQN